MKFHPTSISDAKQPFRAASKKDTHAAAAYSKWLKTEVQEAIDDRSPAIPHADAMRQIRNAIKQAYDE